MLEIELGSDGAFLVYDQHGVLIAGVAGEGGFEAMRLERDVPVASTVWN